MQLEIDDKEEYVLTSVKAKIEPVEVDSSYFLPTREGDIFYIREYNQEYYLHSDEEKKKAGQSKFFSIIFPPTEETNILATTNVLSTGIEIENLKKINDKIKKELKRNSKYLHIDIEKAKNQIDNLINQIAKIYFSDIVIELTPFNDIKFKLKLDENKMLFITHIFSEEAYNDFKVAYSFFINKERIISDISSISNVVQAFVNYLA